MIITLPISVQDVGIPHYPLFWFTQPMQGDLGVHNKSHGIHFSIKTLIFGIVDFHVLLRIILL
jgi:hypothetical protein